MARLFVLSGSRIGSTFDFFETSTVGRGEDADIVIVEPSISRSHARLIPRPDPGQWKIVDLKSSNGVFVGGKRVTSGIIAGGETFRLGEIEIRLRDDAGEPGTPASNEQQVSVENDSGGDAGFELEFGDDLDEAIAGQAGATGPPTRTIPPAPGQPKASIDAGSRVDGGSRAGARATAQRAQRRQEALKGSSVATRVSVAGTANPSGSSRPVLQYSAAHHGSGGDDLAQWSSGKRALVVLFGVALMAGIAYGAFTLTRTARDHSASLTGELAE